MQIKWRRARSVGHNATLLARLHCIPRLVDLLFRKCLPWQEKSFNAAPEDGGIQICHSLQHEAVQGVIYIEEEARVYEGLQKKAFGQEVRPLACL